MFKPHLSVRLVCPNDQCVEIVKQFPNLLISSEKIETYYKRQLYLRKCSKSQVFYSQYFRLRFFGCLSFLDLLSCLFSLGFIFTEPFQVFINYLMPSKKQKSHTTFVISLRQRNVCLHFFFAIHFPILLLLLLSTLSPNY